MKETDLWKTYAAWFEGWWDRIECHHPEGFPDMMGIWNGQVMFIELKIGPPKSSLLRPKQKLWLTKCWNLGGNAWIMVGGHGKLEFFRDVELARKVDPPPFFLMNPKLLG